jgi:hypothetical protein
MQASLAAHVNQIPPNVITNQQTLDNSLVARARERNTPVTAYNNRSRSATPWYLSHCLFLAILMIRMLRHSSEKLIPWWLVFSPIFLSAATMLLVKSSEAYLVYTNRSNTPQVLSYRVYCALVDHVGYTMTIVMTCVYLSSSVVPNVATVCSPLIMTSIMSLTYRLMNLPPLQSRTIGRLFISSLFNCVVHSMVRIIQPFLLVLKIDSHIDIPWTLVAAPVWILAFGGFVVMSLLIYFSCFLHAHANAILRIHASKLMLLCAFQLMVVSLCSFLSTLWYAHDKSSCHHACCFEEANENVNASVSVSVLHILVVDLLSLLRCVATYRLTTALDEHREIKEDTCLKIFMPLVGMCITIAICYPLTLTNSTRYHVSTYTTECNTSHVIIYHLYATTLSKYCPKQVKYMFFLTSCLCILN